MSVKFTKMHGLGNDFMVIDAINQSVNLDSNAIQSLADRHFGIGFDQLLLVEKATTADALFRYRIFNANGSEVAQCGNGARCFARFVQDKKLSSATSIPVETMNGRLVLHLVDNNHVKVDMGTPILTPTDIPLLADQQAITYTLNVASQNITLAAISMGNPHAVIIVDDVDSAPVATLGPALESHPSFPEKANIGFMQIVDAEHVKLRVYERGTGETMACGSGACAAVVAGILQKKLAHTVNVELPGGHLSITWNGDDHPVLMTGPTESVYEGIINL